jgi:protein-tyrosine phosphatase
MIDFHKTVIGLADLHSHVVPYVDDGTEDYEEAKELISQEYDQGVRTLVMTVHFRNGMFDTPISKVKRHFSELQEWLHTTEMKDMNLYLSREYHCDERLAILLDAYAEGQSELVYEDISYNPREEILPFGQKKCILLEFSSDRMQNSEFEIFIQKASQAGLTPIIAHAERCPAVQDRPTIVYKLRDQGALVQVNCESLIARAGTRAGDTANALVDNKLADVVSSDCHDLKRRPPNIKKCYAFLRKKYGVTTADRLLRDNANSLIYGE